MDLTPPPTAAVTPDAPKGAPSPGAVTPPAAPGVASPPKAPGALPPAPTPEERFAQLEEQTKKLAVEGMQRAKEMKELKRLREEAAKEKEAIAKDKAEMDSYRREREDRKRNPAKYLEADYGPEWYDKLSQVKLTGSPTPDLVASHVDDKFKSFEERLAERDAAWEKRFTERDKQAQEREWQEHGQGAIDYVKKNADKYPLIHAFEVTDNLPAFIWNHYQQSGKEDEEGNRSPGELLTAEQAAEKIESLLAKRVEAAQKSKSLASTAAQVPDPKQTQPRRSLSTDMTATQTGNTPPPKDDSERFLRLKQKWAEEERGTRH